MQLRVKHTVAGIVVSVVVIFVIVTFDESFRRVPMSISLIGCESSAGLRLSYCPTPTEANAKSVLDNPSPYCQPCHDSKVFVKEYRSGVHWARRTLDRDRWLVLVIQCNDSSSSFVRAIEIDDRDFAAKTVSVNCPCTFGNDSGWQQLTGLEGTERSK